MKNNKIPQSGQFQNPFFHRCWNWPDSVVFCCFFIGTVLTVWYCVVFLFDFGNSSNRKTTKYHTVRPVPTSMKTTKYHTVRTVPIEK
jgi:hypothetical protein